MFHNRCRPFRSVVPKLFFLVAPWLMVNPSRGPPALKQVQCNELENRIHHKNLVINDPSHNIGL